MYIPFEIGDKKFLLKPYTTKQEKEILLLSSFDVNDPMRVIDLLDIKTDVNINELSQDELKVLLYQFRTISLGDEIDVKFECPNCGQVNESSIEGCNFIMPSIRNDDDVIKLPIELTDENLHEFLLSDIDVDELDIEEFEELKERVKMNQIRFDFVKHCKCIKCKSEKSYDLSDIKYIIEVMSDDTLMTLYKTYNYMVFFGHYTKEDIDSMLPFERSIFVGLLQKIKEDIT